ncbi:MAG: lipoprotein [Alteromonas sp.]|uniref:LPS translocon maturation chaperone LptM n=1 Tax=Alteromonas sp. TaxID=232 RepID=UPI0032D90A7F
MLNKLAVFLLTLSALSGCGYKGALYLPDAPPQNSPPPSDVSSDASFDASDSKNSQNTVSHFVSGSAPKTPVMNTPMIAPITKFGDSN